MFTAPVGDPVLGPTAFPHRESAIEILQAVLAPPSDSTHISADVTAGYSLGMFRWRRACFTA